MASRVDANARQTSKFVVLVTALNPMLNYLRVHAIARLAQVRGGLGVPSVSNTLATH
jgi:fumarate hydratase class II